MATIDVESAYDFTAPVMSYFFLLSTTVNVTASSAEIHFSITITDDNSGWFCLT